MKDNFLQQFIRGPTHIAGNKLDFLLSNSPEIIDNISTFTPVESKFPSDHYLVNLSLRLKFKRAMSVKRKSYNYMRANFEYLCCRLQRLSPEMFETNDVDIYWSQWKNLFLGEVQKCVPVKVIQDTNSPPWIDGEVRHIMRKKYRALKKYRDNRTEERKRKLRSLSNDIKKLVRCKHRNYLYKIQGSFSENPKLFWSYHKAVLHHRSGVESVITYNGQTAN
jgi:hypothetical protein